MRPTIGAQPTGAQVVGAACRSVVGASAAGRYRRSVRAIRRFTVRPVLPEPLLALGELAINLRWSWHVGTQELFKAVDPVRWEASGHDPIRLLGALEPDRLTTLSGDRRFLRQLAAASEDLHEYLSGPRWYQGLGDDVPARIAYFSPEFGIAAVLPQYSGGLGILAGDHLKTASDLGVPLVGVGLLYRHGYFRQDLSREGWQQERYPLADPDGLPLTLLRESDDTPVRIEVGLPEGHRLYARVWLASVGRVPLLMLDSDVEENTGLERDVTDRLYGGTTEHRLLQELLLGIGGVRALRAYARVSGAPSPEVFHTNEGHAGFLGLERIRELVDEGGLDFDAALEVTRAGTVFTTHTPVPAGIDRFPAELIEQHFGGDTGSAAVPVERILALGAENYEGGEAGVFNMAVMGMRLAQRANGVSQLHRSVSREMFRGLWPGFDTDDVPIGSVTNGVHAPTWVAPELAELARRETSVELVEDDQDWERLDALPASAVWDVKRRLRLRLVTDTRARLRRSWLYRGASPAELAWVDGVLDPDVLTIGFARRAASYKRLTLMMRDRDRLERLLLHPERPIQLVIAGKAHPNDETGKRLIQEVVRFADDPAVRHRIVFLPNYDIAMAQTLYPGCDVWLNNPLRPYEACGTSGMKAALNGGLNVSVRDGWWDEWHGPDFGWSIPSAEGIEDNDRRDDIESVAMYELLENEVAPRFYDRAEGSVPTRWLEMVGRTLQNLGPRVLASRMMRDYVETLYRPAAASSRALNADWSGARDLADWKRRVRAEWPQVRVEHVESEGVSDTPQVGDVLGVRVFTALGSLHADDVDVQVVHGQAHGDDQLSDPVAVSLGLAESYDGGHCRFDGEVKLTRTGPFGYTVRVLPKHERLAATELGLIALPPAPAAPPEPHAG
jgi:starch phosphorylase